MKDEEVSKLGVIFSYDPLKNVLTVSLHQAHVLPRAEAERVWRVTKTFAASHPNRPTIALEAGGKRLEYRQVELSSQYYLFEETSDERRCLALMTSPIFVNSPALNSSLGW